MVLTHRQIRLPYNASKFLESFNNMAEITLCKTGDQVPAQDFDILGPHRCIALDVRAHLKAHTCNKELFHSGPLDVENPGSRKWQDRVKSKGGTPEWQARSGLHVFAAPLL